MRDFRIGSKAAIHMAALHALQLYLVNMIAHRVGHLIFGQYCMAANRRAARLPKQPRIKLP